MPPAATEPASTSTNVVWHHATVTRQRRAQLNHHASLVLWFTGLSGSGKSTIAHGVEERLYQQKCRTYVLDGDNIRHGLCGDLGFSNHDRHENIRRIGEVAKLFLDAGVIILTAFISPFQVDRHRVQTIVGPENFLEVYCRCSLEVCESRDVKGLYKKARQGLIPEFTGISSPYEVPEQPALILDTDTTSLDACIQQVMDLLSRHGNLAHT